MCGSLLQFHSFSADMPLPEDFQVYGLTGKCNGKNEASFVVLMNRIFWKIQSLHIQKNKLLDFFKESS